MSEIIQELQSLACTFSMIKVELRRFRKQILRTMSDAAFDRRMFALQRELHELLSNLHIGPKITQSQFSEKQTFIASCFSCFTVEKP